MLINLLINAGLNEKEAAVYLTCLELGASSILNMAEHSKIKRSTVYEIIPSLEEKGLIKKTKKGKKYLFLAENPKTVLIMLKEREKRFTEALPEMMSLFNAQENRPKVFFYQGKDEVRALYEDTIREKKSILNYTSILNLYKYLDKAWVDDYIERRVKSQISTKIIAWESVEAHEWQKTADTALREMRLVKANNLDFSADVHIYGDKVIITTYRKDIFSILIEDSNIAAMQRHAFELMWKNCSK